jgi:DNA-binding SARP family transcriptional activator
MRLDVPVGPMRALWVTAAPLYEDGSRVVFQIRMDGPRDHGTRPHRIDGRLQIFALGPLRVEAPEGVLAGDWLDQRAGQLLRLLVCERARILPTDVIAEALWPNAGATTPNTVRYFVHALRERLEPARPRRAESSFVACRHGGYTLRGERVWIDADEFEQEVRRGMAALAAGERGLALARLERAMDLYRDDFLSDEPYAEWALAERERLRVLAASALRGLSELRRHESEVAAMYLERLADMEPFDDDVQRELISAWLRLGRRSRAVRHYQAFQLRVLRAFGDQPDFDLADLVLQGSPRRERSAASRAMASAVRESSSACAR